MNISIPDEKRALNLLERHNILVLRYLSPKILRERTKVKINPYILARIKPKKKNCSYGRILKCLT
jgi:hypothetical protein